jgi:hypothetical protein
MGDVFTIVPAPPRALLLVAAFSVLILAILAMLGYFAYSSRATRFEISADGLSIRGTLYGRTIGWREMRLDEAAAVDLGARPDLRPTMRTNGVGLPGYRAGWFRLRGGRGLLFVTDPSSVVVVPTTRGYTLMLSVDSPDRFIEALLANRPVARGHP